MFSLMGQTLSYGCKLSPSVQYHIWSVFIKPVLRSGLPALPIRPNTLKTLTTFHHKVLRGILKLSLNSPVVPLYFLLGELPMEAMLHLDIFSLFWNIWSNPHTKIHDVVKYILKMSDNDSLTWTAHLRILFQLYSLPDPLALLEGSLWSKEKWKEYNKTRVISFHESALRNKAIKNYKLKYLNVQLTGLTGRPHPILSWVLTTQDVLRVRIHLKMLSGDYLCQGNLAKDRGLDPSCLLCKAHYRLHAPVEDILHVLTMCRATSDTRLRIVPELLNCIAKYFPTNSLLKRINHEQLCQFILDPTSLNLPMDCRIQPNHSDLPHVMFICRNLCFALHKTRIRQLTDLRHLSRKS